MHKFIEKNAFLRSISIFLATLVFCIAFIFIIFPILSIILTYRCIVGLAAKWFLKDKLGKLVSSQSSIFASFGCYTRKTMTMVVALQVDTPRINLQKFCNLVEKQLLSATIPGSNQLLYPEFTSLLSNWMGYLFWVPCTNFDIKNHVVFLKDIDAPPCNPDDPMYVNNLMAYLVRDRIWERNKPLWEFILAENVIPQSDPRNNKSLIILKANHVMGDGWSFFKVLNKLFGSSKILRKSAKAQFKNQLSTRSGIMAFLTGLWMWIKLPFEMTELLLTVGPNTTQIPQVKVPESSFGPDAFGLTQEILPLDHLKRLKTNLGVDFHSLILAGIAAGVRNVFIQIGEKVPDNVKLAYPLPMPGHPDKLRNHMSGGFILLPIGEPDPGKRVQMISYRVQSWMRAGLPLPIFHISRLIGCIPMPILRSLVTTPPILFTNIVGPPEPIYWDGKPISDAKFFTNLPSDGPGGIVYGTGVSTYCNRTNLVVGGLRCYFPDVSHIQQFMEECIKGWEELEMLVNAYDSNDQQWWMKMAD